MVGTNWVSDIINLVFPLHVIVVSQPFIFGFWLGIMTIPSIGAPTQWTTLSFRRGISQKQESET